MTYGAETFDTDQTSTEQTSGQTYQSGNITYNDRNPNTWVTERAKVVDIISNVRKMIWSWAGHNSRLKYDRWTSRITTWHMTRKDDKGDQPSGGETTWKILQRHDLAEDSARQANLETTCRDLRPTTGHYSCPMMFHKYMTINIYFDSGGSHLGFSHATGVTEKISLALYLKSISNSIP